MSEAKVSAFIEKQKDLVDHECKYEVQETANLIQGCPPQELQKRGVALLNLRVSSMRTGLGGKSLVDLEPHLVGNQLPSHKFRNGDIVGIERYSSANKNKLSADGEGRNTSGVVYKVTDNKITLVLRDELPDDLQDRCSIVKLANEITYKRLTEALNALLAHFTKSPTSLTRVLFGLQDPSYESSIPKIDFYNPNLNDSQKDAVKFALSAREIALIHGPPGTGKTYTLVEVIQQLVKRGERVLVCGPSNISVDNLVERLSKSRIPLVRVGHPARILPQVLNHSLDILIRTSHEGQIVSDVIKEMDAILSSIQKSKNRFERKKMYGELKELKKELKSREIKVLNELVKGSRIVLSTLNGAANKVLLKEEFDTVVIDECTQSVEPEDWIALLKGKKAILAGDHLQLPPTVKSISTFPDVYAEINGLSDSKSSSGKSKGKKSKAEATKNDESKNDDKELKAENLAVTLFDRLLRMYGNQIKRLLNVQYRMNQDIMEYCSNALYEGKLIAHESNASHLLCQLPYVESTPETTVPLILIDTAGMDYHESVSSSNTNSTATLLEESKYNEHEAEVVTSITEKLISAGLKPSDIAIITPYNAQVSLLISLIKESYPDIEIGSVDGFQGREKEAVIVSLVRSNDKGEIGFLKDSRRINVAVTRAKRLLVVAADSDTIGKSAFLKGMVEFMEERGEVRYPGYD